MNDFFIANNNNFSFKHSIDESPDQNLFSMHTHSECEIYYFMSESGAFHIEGTTYPLSYGDILIMDNAESHFIEIDPDKPYERCSLLFKKDFIKSFDASGALLLPFETRKPGKNNLYKNIDFKNENYKIFLNNMMESSVNKELSIISNITPLLYEIYKAFNMKTDIDTPVEETRINQVIKYIMDNLEKPISLDLICSKFYISKPQLCRSFKSSTGTTVWNYITIKRLIMAKNLMDSGILPSKAALASGFTDYSVFFKAYKKHFGFSPTSD